MKFFNLLNTLHPSIKFTLDKSRTPLPFLDSCTLLTNENGKLQTGIYYKPTDSKQYLLYTSCHPKHTRNSIPYKLARRLKTIISEDSTLLVRLEELKTFLLKQKYPSSLIDDSIAKIKALKRSDLLKQNESTNKGNNVIPYVTTVNPNNPEIYPQIRQNKSILLRDDRMKTIYKQKMFLKSKRQPPNLKKLLTNAKISVKQQEKFEVTKM